MRRTAYYRAYIASEPWRRFRAAWLLRHDGRCAMCGTSGGPLDLHHRTYARLGHELDTDVVALCRDCHRYVHLFRRVWRVAVRALRRAFA